VVLVEPVTDVADEALGLVGDKFPGSAFTDVFDVTNIGE
jgi:hypothetical protein